MCNRIHLQIVLLGALFVFSTALQTSSVGECSNSGRDVNTENHTHRACRKVYRPAAIQLAVALTLDVTVLICAGVHAKRCVHQHQLQEILRHRRAFPPRVHCSRRPGSFPRIHFSPKLQRRASALVSYHRCATPSDTSTAHQGVSPHVLFVTCM